MKAIIRVEGDTYVVEPEVAVHIRSMVEGAEMYAEKWRRKEDGGTTYHVYKDDEPPEPDSIALISESLYRMAKLAGKPE